MSNYERYRRAGRVLTCPVCGGRLDLREEQRALVCGSGHSFDIARQGYVNLYLGKPAGGYSKESFQMRQRILEKGMYAHILDEICSILREACAGSDGRTGASDVCRGRFVTAVAPRTLLDAGCGEGYYTREIASRLGSDFSLELYGVDLSRDSVQLAASAGNRLGGAAGSVRWVVADIGHLPAGDGTVDFLLDIFTSANYEEFQRVLAKDGLVIKVIPGEGHVRELREAARDQLHHKDYRQRKGAEVFAGQFDLILQKNISRTFSVSPEERDCFIRMSPLLFQVDRSKVDWRPVKTITVEGELLIGRKKRR